MMRTCVVQSQGLAGKALLVSMTGTGPRELFDFVKCVAEGAGCDDAETRDAYMILQRSGIKVSAQQRSVRSSIV